MTTQTFVEVVQERLRQIEGETQEIRTQIGEVQADAARRVGELQSALREKEELLSRLREVLRMEKGEHGLGEGDVDASACSMAFKQSDSANLAEAAYRLLLETRREFHYRELAAALLDRGIAINGRDPAINLVAHLVRDDRFVRPKRGVYALREWNANVRSVGVRRGGKQTPRRRRPAQRQVRSRRGPAR